MELKWHIAHVDNIPAEPKPNLTFGTFEELLQAVESYRRECFVELALDELHYADGLVNRSIVAVYEDGYEWEVVGFIVDATPEEVESLGLPKWKAKYREVPKE